MIKLFNHVDFDAAGCAIIAKLAYGMDKVDVTYCGYNDINEKVKAYIDTKEYLNYTHTYITDISINEELAAFINSHHPEGFKEGFNLCETFTLLDHHATALPLNKYWWCSVVVEIDGTKTCGTELLYSALRERFKDLYGAANRFSDFVEIVRRYDTWDWKVLGDVVPTRWNNLFYLYGTDRFVEDIYNRLQQNYILDFNNTDLLLLTLEDEKKAVYFKKKEREMQTIKLWGYLAGVVFAEQYISELGNNLCDLYKGVDIIVIISPTTIGYRTVKDNINLGNLVKIFGGGGHPKAAGSQISKKQRLKYIKILFRISISKKIALLKKRLFGGR